MALGFTLGFAFTPQGCGGPPSSAAAYGGVEVPESIAQQLRACAAEHADHIEPGERSISFNVKLASDGRADERKLLDSTLGDEELEDCMAHALRSLSVDDLPMRLSENGPRGPGAPESRVFVGQAEIALAVCLADPPCLLALTIFIGASYISVVLFVDATQAYKPPRIGPTYPVSPKTEPEPAGEPRTAGPSPPWQPPPDRPKEERESCGKMMPQFIRCDDHRLRYRFWSESEAFKEVVKTKGQGVRKAKKRDRAEDGPCINRGGFHTNVLRGGRSAASIVGCECCDDSSGKVVKRERADVIYK